VTDAAAVAANVADVHRRLAAAGGEGVKLLAVTKGFGAPEVAAARAAGVDGIGENYAQELLAKATALDAEAPNDPVPWHFIGHVQRNKVRVLAPRVRVWQSVDRVELAGEIAKRAPGATVLVQVNASGEAQKAGCAFDEGPALVARCRELGLAVQGLMAIGPTGPPDAARGPFERVVALADELGLPERSIGMTDDLEVAVEAGSTMVRVGRALFGPRPARGDRR
jgi:pyridoxal phosphate enzyme (YggS family)